MCVTPPSHTLACPLQEAKATWTSALASVTPDTDLQLVLDISALLQDPEKVGAGRAFARGGSGRGGWPSVQVPPEPQSKEGSWHARHVAHHTTLGTPRHPLLPPEALAQRSCHLIQLAGCSTADRRHSSSRQGMNCCIVLNGKLTWGAAIAVLMGGFYIPDYRNGLKATLGSEFLFLGLPALLEVCI